MRDEYTTLPERSDRPLFIHLDVHWRYSDVADAIGAGPCALRGRRAGARRLRGRVHEFVSESIQQLVHEMGKRLLERYPQLGSLVVQSPGT